MNEQKANIIARFEREIVKNKQYNGEKITKPYMPIKIKDFDKQLKEFKKKKKRKGMKRKANICNKCNSISFKVSDDIYFIKYNCCEKCYIKHIEGKNNEE